MDEDHLVQDEKHCHFTVFIRLPFPRGDFVDPPPIDWDSSKDRALWDILSRAPKGREADWQALCVDQKTDSFLIVLDEPAIDIFVGIRAEQFDVTLPFLLQQAAWLYEQQLSQVKAQLRKATRPASIGNSPTPGSASGSGIAGGHAMIRGGSGGSRVPSSLSNRPRDRPVSQGDASTSELTLRTRGPLLSRASSTNTVQQVPKLSAIASQQSLVERQSNFATNTKYREGSLNSTDALQAGRPTTVERSLSRSEKAEESSSSSSDSDAAVSLIPSQAYMRRSRYPGSKPPLGPLSDADEDQQNSPPFLPFSDVRALTPAHPGDPSATVHLASQKPTLGRLGSSPLPASRPSLAMPTGHSSSSSIKSQSQPQSQGSRSAQNPLSSLSPRQRRITKEGSEGTPSMGSSFSDLDDASVTQSALEEALANEMNHGGVASRMSSISQALRSRYL